MNFPHPFPPLEMWSGVECTINRVGDTYFDQLERNGHYSRLDDLSRFAELGIRTIRYPIQWERIAPHGLAQANWSWADERLELLRTLGITPIVGLTHHGSGPRSTSLVEPSFAEGLAQFAEAVAERYPWVEYYTPVNEPLTTARFSGLYGHWYPHGRNRLTFARALLTQCRAIVLSMQAIRRVNPRAQLIQTEDLGKVFSTPLLNSQAEMENERRWLSFDLLCGCLDSTKPMWKFLISSGVHETELAWFLEHPCIPDVLGIDYYLTSERFLDEDVTRYPVEYHTRNEQQEYADVEVVRVNTGTPLPVGHYERMRETWERYGLPIAITEAHLGSTREEQVRWLVAAWDAAQMMRQEGAQVRAVTAWSLLGAFDWNTLVTRISNFYEPGVFDVRGTQPRPTALARIVRTLATNQHLDEPVLAQPGWWLRPDRFLYQSSLSNTQLHSSSGEMPVRGRPVIIIGKTGVLEEAFARQCEARNLPYHFITCAEIDALDARALHANLLHLHPWAVITTTGCDCHNNMNDDSRSWSHSNASSHGVLADLCAQQGIALLAFSSSLVFNGLQHTPYVESTPITSCCSPGQRQAQAEEQVLQRCPSALVIRTGVLFHPGESTDVVTDILDGILRLRCSDTTVHEPVIAVTYIPDLVQTSLDLLIDGESGFWHLVNGGVSTETICGDAVTEQTTKTLGESTQKDTRVISHCLLHSERGQLLPSLDDALTRYEQERTRAKNVCKV